MSQSLFARFRNEITKVYVGEDDTIQALVVALIAGGHVLIEGNPGLAKTTLAQTLASCIAGTFRRVQFTIDLLPSDITGANIYRLHDGTFQFIPGPVFTHVLLADELNRAPAKTQSALLEAMQERQVTVDTETHPLPRPFIVLATQNPHEDQGTYPLPDSQLDRFMFRLRLGYPTPAQELQIIHFASRAPQTPSPVLTPEACLAISEQIETIEVHDALAQYIVDIIRHTRTLPEISRGASPRAGTVLLRAAKAHAFLNGRTYVIPDDVQWAVPKVLNHRLALHPHATRDVDHIIRDTLRRVPFK